MDPNPSVGDNEWGVFGAGGGAASSSPTEGPTKCTWAVADGPVNPHHIIWSLLSAMAIVFTPGCGLRVNHGVSSRSVKRNQKVYRSPGAKIYGVLHYISFAFS
jgi:hypothetical protein